MTIRNSENGKEPLLLSILKGIAINSGVGLLSTAAHVVVSMTTSLIIVGEWDESFNKINKMVHDLNPTQYSRYRLPTPNKNHYELVANISYVVNLGHSNWVKISSELNEEKTVYREKKLKIWFYGKNKYKIREEFVRKSLQYNDGKHIRVRHMNDTGMSHDILPHSFENIVMDKTVKNHIQLGLKNWYDSKDWYTKHQLVHKIGILLYGEPGTGKSTIARAVSTMFGCAPIMTLDQQDIMSSISRIIQVRKRYDGLIIVLIEDFDMFFTTREENSQTTDNDEDQKRDINQNTVFQLLDGIYSTDNTIYIATTNYIDRLDEAMIRYGRFDIQEELKFFTKEQALECVKMFDYDENVLDSFNLSYPVQPSYLQGKLMEYRAKNCYKGDDME